MERVPPNPHREEVLASVSSTQPNPAWAVNSTGLSAFAYFARFLGGGRPQAEDDIRVIANKPASSCRRVFMILL